MRTRLTTHRRIWLGVLLVTASLLAFVNYYVFATIPQIRTGEADRDVAVVADTLAERVQQSVQVVELSLQGMALRYQTQSYQPREVFLLLRQIEQTLTQTRSIGITDARGLLIHSSRSHPPPAVSIVDRDQIRFFLDGGTAERYLAGPTRNAVDGQWQLSIAVPFFDEKKQLAGIITAVIDPGYFQKLITRSASPQDDVITLLYKEHQIVARQPISSFEIGQSLAGSSLYRAVDASATGRAGGVFRDEDTGSEVVATARRLYHDLLIVSIARPVSGILRQWRITAAICAITTLCLLLLEGFAFAATDRNLRDIQLKEAQLEALNRELRAETQRAEHAAEVKSTFLANMSHEIRTPLGGLLGYADLLLKSDLSRKQTDWMVKLNSAGDQLLAVINDILDYSKLETGNFSIDAKPVLLETLVDEVSSMMALQADRRGLALILTLEPDLPKWIRVDPVRLKQILMNLVGNAIKFTDRGSVSISVARAKLGSRAALAFEVKDTGIGIPEEKVAAVFERFTQADTKASRGRGGTGLGLSISRRLAERMEGTLALESKVGAGTTVCLTVPLVVAPEPVSRPVTAPTAERAGRILLVDDLPMNLEIAGAMLIAHGHQVTTASSGVEAIDLALSNAFDAILLDINLPDLDGYEVAREIRKLEPPDRRTPILALTANALPEHIVQAMSAGMDGHIAKPIEERVLTSELAKTLGAGLAAAGAAAAPERPLVDEQAVRTLRRTLGNKRLLDLKAMFWQTWDTFLATTDNPRSDRGRLAAETHDLVSHAGNVGYLQLAHVCRELSHLAGHDETADLAPLIERARKVGEATRREDRS